MKSDNDKKIATLKNSFKDCEQLYSVYSDIAETYRAIAKGDYISRLVEEERIKREGKGEICGRSRGGRMCSNSHECVS